VPALDPALRPLAAPLLPRIAGCSCHSARAVRSAAAACAATLAAAQPDATLPVLIRCGALSVLPPSLALAADPEL